jgi:GT2 family glycosyltransferase
MTNPGKVDLSIIIISYNTKVITESCLKSIFQSLRNSTINYEIIVIDNASTDESKSMLKEFNRLNSSKLHIIFNSENVGFAKANNQAVKEAKGEYILFLNSDIVVLNNSIIQLFDYYRQHDHVVNFLGGRLLNKDMSPQSSCGPFYSLPVAFAALFLRGDYWGLTRYSPDKIKEVDWVSGACFITKKEYFKSINGFDENIFMYMDEIDLFYRAKKAGYRVFFYPTAQFIHLGSASSHGRTQPIIQVFKGYTYFYKKHHNNPVSLFLLRFMLQLKARISILIGHITNNNYLIETYEKARKLV